MTEQQPAMIVDGIFAGNGEMACLMRSFDWASSVIGPVANWSQSLRTAVSICLNSRFPMVIWWGKELALLYNDAWRPALGSTKHPQALGQPGREVWSEIWHIIGSQLEGVLATGQATWADDMLLLLERYGYTEETYYTYSYSPIFLETGEVGGAFTAVTETTQRVLGERRLATLRDLAVRAGEAKTTEQACQTAMQTLADNPADIPFALLYLLNAETQAVLCASTPAQINPRAARACIDLTQDTQAAWSLGSVLRNPQPLVIDNLVQQYGELPFGSWNQPPQQALVVPIRASGQNSLVGMLVLGVNPCRSLDEDYRNFFEMTAGYIAAAIANARAYEEERKRSAALAELDRAKTTFFSNVSHEFRTPLTLMLGPLAEILGNHSELLSIEREQLQMVHRNGLRLLKLVNTLLDFSRIEAGRIQAVYQPTDLATFTTELASVFRSAVERAGMNLVVDCPPLPELIYVDREMWEKIVLNLLSNAFKFTFAGEISVALRYCNDSVELEVRDTGIGIPSEQLPRLFERFHRVAGARGRTYEGTGIGLSLVQELARQHGGSIKVTSVINKGSIFTVRIPTGSSHIHLDKIGTAEINVLTVTRGDAYVEEALRWLPQEGSREWAVVSGEYATSARQAFPQPSKARILLVDDNADMRDYVKRLLSQYEVEAVESGVAALASVEKQLPDLVLTDVMMPGLDGFGLLRELRASSRTREVPIVLLSARAGEESRLEGLSAGADDYLIKPFSARELLARVEVNLKMAQLRQAAAVREQELRLEAQAAKERTESVLSSINDQFLALDTGWRYTYVNERVVEVVGMSKEDILGKCVWELFPEVVGSEFYIQVHRAVAEQTIVQFEYFYPTMQRWFVNRVYPNSNGVSILVADITANKQAEVALEESAFRLSLALAAARMGDWSWDAATNIVTLCDRAAEILSISDTQIPWTVIRELLHPEDRLRALSAVENAIASGGDYDVEYRVILPNQVQRWVAAKGRVLYTAAGQVILMVGVVQDVTERKQAEQELQQSEAKFRLMADSAPVFIWMADTDGNCTYYNQPWLDFTGYKTLEIALTNRWQGVHPEDVQSCIDVYQAAFNRREPLEVEYRYRRADGEYRWILDQGVPLEAADGTAGYIGSAIDITDRKRLEDVLEQLLIREQAARAASETARESAEAANRIKDEFLAVLSHELRTPLNPILGWTRLLQTRKYDEKTTALALETIERNAKLQTQLIEDLLDVSRILQGKLSLKMSAVNLAGIITAANETVRLAAESKSIQVETVFESHDITVLGDSGRLQQVVWNLLSNAMKFTDSGGRVEVRLRTVKGSRESGVGNRQDPDSAIIQVSDTGKGINPEFLPYMFEYFRQADASTTRHFGGLGLGLAIARHIVELHGGTIAAESKGENQGATFTVQLPLRTSEPQLNQVRQLSDSYFDLNGVQILVVDDDADMREFLAFVLQESGATVTLAACATQALEALENSQPDILLSDIGMPEIDGYMLMRFVRLRLAQQKRQIQAVSEAMPKAIALTAYAGEYNQQQALAAGFQMHLAKPVEPEILIRAIATLVGRA